MRNQKISIGFFPAGNNMTASSRIRIFSMLPYLDTLSIKYFIKPSLRHLIFVNTVFIQKRITTEILKKTRLAKLLRKKIIYDIDDFGSALFYSASPGNVKKMLMLADLITTGSDRQKEILETEYSVRNVRVLPEIIDYFPEKPVTQSDNSDDRLRVIWFGLYDNFSTFAKYIDILRKNPSIDIIVVTNSKKVFELSQEYPFIHFEPWSLETFIPILRSCQLSILTHEGSNYDRAKTNNKMIASITWGVPAIVSNTPDYSGTAKKAGVENAVFSNSDELLEIIEKLKAPQARRTYLNSAQPVIWREHSPLEITKQFITLCTEIHPINYLDVMKSIISSL